MMKYIYRDVISAVEYLPYGLALGVPVAAVFLCLMWHRQKAKNEKPALAIPLAVFVLYMAVMLVITFLSRESGSSSGVADLELFSTWGINDRNNAYVIENVLLFIPWGFTCSWAFARARHFLRCTLYGALVSVTIECLQLLTKRGFFQVDDILTNILGTIIGYLLFWLLLGWRLQRKENPSAC